MAFTYPRTIRFADTDAAGVVFFPNYLAIGHEAYEESLAAAGIELQSFFGEHAVVVPVSKSQAEYLRPLTCGDRCSRCGMTRQPLSVKATTTIARRAFMVSWCRDEAEP